MNERKSLIRMMLLLGISALVLGLCCLKASRQEEPDTVRTAVINVDKPYVNVPIIMYHSILPDVSKKGDYVITPSQLDSDLAYLKQNGYKAVTLDSLIEYCDGTGKLPEKPVVITFDDGQLNNLTYALPLLEKHDFCAAFSVVGRYTEAACEDAAPDPSYSYLDFDDIKKLLDSGRAELVNHSYNMHSLDERRGALQRADESYKEYRRAMLNDVSYAQRLFKRELGIEPVVYAYPFGLVCPAAGTVLKMLGFKASLGCEEKPNHLTRGDSSALTELHRYNRPAFVSTEEFMKRALAE